MVLGDIIIVIGGIVFVCFGRSVWVLVIIVVSSLSRHVSSSSEIVIWDSVYVL
jgi:hypothetical protein